MKIVVVVPQLNLEIDQEAVFCNNTPVIQAQELGKRFSGQIETEIVRAILAGFGVANMCSIRKVEDAQDEA